MWIPPSLYRCSCVLQRQPGPFGLLCLRRLSSVLHLWIPGGLIHPTPHPTLAPKSQLPIICSSITQDDMRNWHDLLPTSPAHRNVSSSLAKYLLVHGNTFVMPSSQRENRQGLPFPSVEDFTWGMLADRAWAR
jgi:hypothetical protein